MTPAVTRLCRLLATLLRLTLAIGTLVVVGAGPSYAASSATVESQLVRLVNAERRARGLRPLQVRSDLTAVAPRQSARMAQRGRLVANPSLGSQTRRYRRAREVLVVGSKVSRLHAVVLASPTLRARVLDRHATHLGIGVVRRNGGLWVTEVVAEAKRSTR